MTCSETIFLAVLGLCLLGSLNGDVFFSVKEDAQNGTVVGHLPCTENLSLDDQKHWFELRHNASKGWDILVGRGFRSISNSSVSMSYSCGSVQKLTFTVHLEPVNKHPPQFCNRSLVVLNIPENTTLGQDLYSFQICDQDRRVVFHAFALKPFTHFKLVRVDTAIKLQLSETFDYDAVNASHVLNYTVSVRDNNQPNSPDTIQLRVHVDDVDDQSPAFSLPLYKCEIPEGTYSSHIFSCSVKAEDQDKGLRTSLDYSIISVLPSTNVFSIDNSGKMTATGVLDRENISSYSLVIKAFQVNRPVDRYNFTTLKIEVKDIDDNSPIMSSTSYSASIMENTANGVEVLQVAASDADLGEFGQFLFVLNETSKAFTINETTGLISVTNSAALDYETVHPPKFDMTVYAKATKGQKHSSPSHVTVTLVDVNDNDPVFQKDLYSFHISKNYSIGSSVGQVKATDADTDGNITYHIVPRASTLFAVNENNGVVTVSGNLTDSCIRVYKQTVMAEDGPATLPSVRRSSVPVTVYVKNVNMFPPVFDSHLYGLVLNISEATTVGTNILELKATDKDLCDNLTYSVPAGLQFGLQNQFLYVAKALDREKIPNYSLTVYVTDGDKNDTATITINIMDENDNDPVFENEPYTFNVTEEQPENVFVGNISATDRDEGMNSAILYELEDGPW